MTERIATTPFGGARMSAALFQLRKGIEDRRSALTGSGGGASPIDKWRLLRELTEARAAFDLTDRSIAVLEALLSFWPQQDIDATKPVIVFPSNAELSLRLRGMAPATLRRHLATLVASGFIQRRDSPNGKRYCHRDARGQIETAFGFDLSPFALAAEKIRAAADTIRARARAVQRLRSAITLHKRDIAKMLEAAQAEQLAGNWTVYVTRLADPCLRLPRQADIAALEAMHDDLIRLRAEVEVAYGDSLRQREISASDSKNERHHQNPHTEYPNESTPPANAAPSDTRHLDPQMASPGDPASHRPLWAYVADMSPSQASEERPCSPLTLQRVLSACPQVRDYARHGIDSWQDLIATAMLLRTMLRISAQAWNEARLAMGDIGAAVAVAAMLERADAIRSFSGYLRALAKQAGEGRFSLEPMLAALERQ